MKKLFLLSALFLFSGIAQTQITKTVGFSGDYPTLKLAFDAINAGTVTGDVTLNIISDIADDNTATLQAGYAPAAYTSVLIRPTGSPPAGHWTLTANITGEMIVLDAATNVTLNGQLDGSSGESNLYFINNGTGTPLFGGAIRFEYGASHNTISYVRFECNSQIDVGAIIFGIGAGAGLGNNNNTIDHCDITKTTSGQLITGISSEGSADNMRNSITFCNIYDWDVHGINLPSPCGRGWQITGNSFYQTSSFTSLAENYGIRVINGDSIAIQWNKIGGSQPNCNGAGWANTDAFNASYGIYAEGDPAMTAYIGGNTVKNIETHGTRFSGIEVRGINASLMGNQIGGWGEGGSGIVMTGIGKIYGICATATSTPTNFEISYNAIRNITAFNLLEDEALCGIYVFGAPSGNTVMVSNNTIENLVSRGNCSGPLVRGIVTSCTAADVTITANQVSNLISNNGGSFATQVQGIVVSGDNGSATVSKNKIYNLLDNCTGNPSIHGVVFYNRNCQIHAINNMISIKNGENQNTVAIYGFNDPGTYGSGTENHLYYFNSVFIGGVSTGNGLTSCYNRDVNLMSTLVNNVFYNERMSGVLQNFAVTVNSNESGDFYSDHNDLFTLNDNVVGSVNGGIAPLSFASWQSAFSPPRDPASFSVFPNFQSITDLHIEMNATLNNTALPIPEVTDDIDGNFRNPEHPDPGINEFTYNSYTVGTGGDYPTLPAAFKAINTGAITGNIYLEIISNNDELDTTQAILGPSGAPGTANYTAVTIRPGGAMPAPPWDFRLIRAFRRNGPMIRLSGATNVTFDGFQPGDSSKKRLIFQNQDAADSLGWVFSFTGGANSNTIKNCEITANCKGYEGAVHFGESFGAPYGNSYNTIENCEICYAHVWVTTAGVLTNGITCDTNEHYNNYNTVKNCDIHDCSGSGILIGRPAAPGLGWDDWGNDAWNIFGNHIYYTHDLGYYRPSYYNAYYRDHNGICIAKGNSHFISSNHIGKWGYPLSTGIKIFGTQHTYTGQPVTIYGNVIDHTSNLLHGIYIENQDANIEYDTIGSPTLTNNIMTSGQVYGIYILNQHNNNVVHLTHNLIANITTEAAWGTGVMMAGIGTNPPGNSFGPNCLISNNQIYNLRLFSGPQCPVPPYGPSTPSVTGIQFSGENATINGNKLYNLSIHGDNLTGAVDSVTGIYLRSTGNNTLFNNMISLEHPDSPYRFNYFISGILDVSSYGNVNNYYYNSVNLTQSAPIINYDPTFCFYRKGYATNIIMNNILCNNIHLYDPLLSIGNFAIGVEQARYATSNYNDLHADDPNRLASSNFGDRLDLAGWQNSFLYPQDLNSVSISPAFTSATDLYCTGPEDLDNLGICIPGISEDITGSARQNPPDLGNNEFYAKVYKEWLGYYSSFWDDYRNWSPFGVPTSSENVRILPPVNYNPEIRYDGATCKDLLIDPGATLSVKPGKYLDILGVLELVKYCP